MCSSDLPRDAVSGTIVQRVLQLVPGVSYSETADERWVPMGETWTVQVGLRLMFPQRAATALAVNFRQNGRDHLLVLVAQSQGNETFLQGVFQKFIYSYEALGGEPSPVSPSGSVPFLEGVVADGLSIERGRR